MPGSSLPLIKTMYIMAALTSDNSKKHCKTHPLSQKIIVKFGSVVILR